MNILILVQRLVFEARRCVKAGEGWEINAL